MTAHRAALAAFCADRRIKLVHVWQTGTTDRSPFRSEATGDAGGVPSGKGVRWSAMLEWPYDPTKRKPLPTERHATGVGEDAPRAVIAGLDRLGFGGLEIRLFVMVYMLGLR